MSENHVNTDAPDMQRLVVIGNGMAATRTIEELMRIAPDAYHITVFGAEPHPGYNRVLLSAVLAGETQFADIIINTLDWYERNAIDLRVGVRITEIDRARRCVIAEDGSCVPYDRLLIATGSRPVLPPFSGVDLPGVLTYRDIHDTEQMIAEAGEAKQAVVIGGGLLGLEAAHGLRQRGVEVTVVHLMPWIMERQLDEAAAAALQASLEARGIRFELNAKTQAITGNGRVEGVALADGRVLPAQFVVVAAGVKPDIDLARKAKLVCDRGIKVSDTMQTFDPRIYAVGECVQHRGVAYGLVEPLYEMAKICAQHLAGFGAFDYRGSVTATRLKVTGVDVFSAGDFQGAEGSEDIVLSDPVSGVYKRLVIKDDRLIGSVLYGDTGDGPWYFQMLREGRKITDIRDRLVFGAAAC